MARSQLIDIDRGWNRIIRESKRLSNSSVDVGLFGSGGDPSNNIAARGAVQEFGASIRVTPKMRGYLASRGVFLKASTTTIEIPSRPFTRTGFDKNKRKLIRAIDLWWKRLTDGSISARKVLNNTGILHTDQIKKALKTRSLWKPNSEVTIRFKRKSAPLINTGEMMNSIKYKIKSRGGQ